MTESINHFARLAAINVSEHIERKGGFAYLSWPYAVCSDTLIAARRAKWLMDSVMLISMGANKNARRSGWSYGREGRMKAAQAAIAMACGQGAASDVLSTKSAAFCAMDAAVKTKRLSWRRASSQWAM